MLLGSDLVEFTDEEGYGKFLDLHECYVKFINLKGIEVQIEWYTLVRHADRICCLIAICAGLNFQLCV